MHEMHLMLLLCPSSSNTRKR